jgi:hypothetical protein
MSVAARCTSVGYNEYSTLNASGADMSRKTIVRLAVATVVLRITAAAWLWFSPSGSGEFRDSPDFRYTAHAYNMSSGTITGGRKTYIEIRVVEKDSGRELWRVFHRPPVGADAPDYGSRGMRFVIWAGDSSRVTVPVAGGRELVLAVP